MIASFCLIWAKRYSRLLMTGEKSDDGVGEEQREGEGEIERVDDIDGDEGTCTIASGIIVSEGNKGEGSSLGKGKTDELKPLEPIYRVYKWRRTPLSFPPLEVCMFAQNSRESSGGFKPQKKKYATTFTWSTE